MLVLDEHLTAMGESDVGSFGEHAKGQDPMFQRFRDLNARLNQESLARWYSYPRWRRVMYLVGNWMVRRSKVRWTWTY
jgi:hypothetical protein